MAEQPGAETRRSPLPERLVLAAAPFTAAATLIALFNPLGLILGTDGILVIGLLAAAAGLGGLLLRIGFRWPPGSWPAGLGLALGLGLLGVATLLLGLFGLLTQFSAWLLIVTGWIALLLVLSQTPNRAGSPPSQVPLLERFLWTVPMIVAGAVALLGACLPPGLIWNGEGKGYDVLEYHLQAPREFFQAGRIQFLPHNVYGNFPQQAEMLYLLLMHLLGDPHAAAIPAQLLHASLGAVAVVLIAGAAPAGRTRWAVAALAACTPWVAYVGSLAYVENALLLFAAAAGALLVRASTQQRPLTGGEALMIGLLLGFAAGCKYTAWVLVALAAPLSWLLGGSGKLNDRLRVCLIMACGIVATLAPWIGRSWVLTGNPVYPFAYQIFGGAAWNIEQAEQWATGHALKSQHAPLLGHAYVWVRELLFQIETIQDGGTRIQPTLFGVGLVVLAVVGMFRSRRGAHWLTIWVLLALAAWTLMTHMPGRFLVPLIAPLCWLALRAMSPDSLGSPPESSSRRISLVAANFAGFAWIASMIGAAQLALLWTEHDRNFYRHTGAVPLTRLFGRDDILRELNEINSATPADARVWLVGEARAFHVTRDLHYTVVFNRDPWLESAAGGDAASAVADLQARGVTHVVFAWREIARLGQTYGFPSWVTPEWVRQLELAGLQRLTAPQGRERRDPAYDVYAVPTPAGS